MSNFITALQQYMQTIISSPENAEDRLRNFDYGKL